MVVTETRLENIANGYLDPSRLQEPFIITRVHEKIKTRKEGNWVYSFVWGNKFDREYYTKNAIDLSPRTAKKLIALYKMEVAISTPDGQVYEMKGNPFKKQYRNKKQMAS